MKSFLEFKTVSLSTSSLHILYGEKQHQTEYPLTDGGKQSFSPLQRLFEWHRIERPKHPGLLPQPGACGSGRRNATEKPGELSRRSD
jgi:hypothetical protein